MRHAIECICIWQSMMDRTGWNATFRLVHSLSHHDWKVDEREREEASPLRRESNFKFLLLPSSQSWFPSFDDFFCVCYKSKASAKKDVLLSTSYCIRAHYFAILATPCRNWRNNFHHQRPFHSDLQPIQSRLQPMISFESGQLENCSILRPPRSHFKYPNLVMRYVGDRISVYA